MCKRKAGSTLTDKEKMFCEEYIVDLDATNAAIRAGYSEDSAKTTAYHVRQRPEVDAYINDLIEKRQYRLRITADEVLIELAKIAFAEPVDFEDENPHPDSHRDHNGGLNARSEVSETNTVKELIPSSPKYSPGTQFKVVDTHPDTGRRSIRYFTLSAKIAALKLLGRHLGLFGTSGKSLPVKPNIIFPRLEEVELDRRAA